MDRKKFLILLLVLYVMAGAAASYLFWHPLPALRLPPSDARAVLCAPPPSLAEPRPGPASVPTEPATPVEAPEPEYIFTASHKSQRLFIRSGPSLEAQVIGSLQPGESGEVIVPGTEWTYLRFGALEGYVYNAYLTLTEKEQADG